MDNENGLAGEIEQSRAQNSGGDSGGKFIWDVDFPLTNNPLVMKQFAMLLLLTGLFMVLLLSFIFAVTGEFSAIPLILLATVICLGGFGLLMLLIMLLFFNNRIRVRFTLDKNGMLMETLDKRVKVANRLAIILGVIARSSGSAGAGLLAASREKEFTDWGHLAGASYNRRHRTIVLRNRWRPVQMVICTPDNYETVAHYISQRIEISTAALAPAAKKSPVPKLLLRTLWVVLASTPVFALPYPFELDILIPLIMLLFALAAVWIVPLMGWVVIPCALILAVQILFIALGESVLFIEEWVFLFLAYAGLAYLSVLSWRAIRGKIPSALMEE